MINYNLDKIQELLRDFYNLTNIKIGIYDNEENELCYYPEKYSDFCGLLRKNPEMERRCNLCDKQAFAQCRKTYKQHIYTCHAGLLECVSPILYDKQIIGYIAIGQIKTGDKTTFSELASHFDPAAQRSLKQRLDELPSIAVDKIHSAIRILDACTGYEYLKSLIKDNENKIDVLIARYVHKNLAEDLYVPSICSHFHLSHSEVYSIFKEYFQTTPAEYIKERRLAQACKLLNETVLPVNMIAKQCGIPDYNYFSKIFKRTFGISPREYRKQGKTL